MSNKPRGPQRPEPTDELATLRRRLQEAEQGALTVAADFERRLEESAKDLEVATAQAERDLGTIQNLRVEVEMLRSLKPQATPPHVARAFEAGARAERARALEQGRVSGLQWGGNTDAKRGLDTFLRELRDERLPLPEFKL